MSTLVERLRDAAKCEALPPLYRTAIESAADALSARLTPPADVVRYDFVPVISADDGEPAVIREQLPNGEYVRYEDHAAAVLALRLELYDANCKVDEAAEALAASEAKRKDAEERLSNLVNAKALAGVRDLVAGWNGENRPDGPYAERHPPRLGATLPKTDCGAVYELDEAMQAARAALDQPKTEDEQA